MHVSAFLQRFTLIFYLLQWTHLNAVHRSINSRINSRHHSSHLHLSVANDSMATKVQPASLRYTTWYWLASLILNTFPYNCHNHFSLIEFSQMTNSFKIWRKSGKINDFNNKVQMAIPCQVTSAVWSPSSPNTTQAWSSESAKWTSFKPRIWQAATTPSATPKQSNFPTRLKRQWGQTVCRKCSRKQHLIK